MADAQSFYFIVFLFFVSAEIVNTEIVSITVEDMKWVIFFLSLIDIELFFYFLKKVAVL